MRHYGETRNLRQEGDLDVVFDGHDFTTPPSEFGWSRGHLAN